MSPNVFCILDTVMCFINNFYCTIRTENCNLLRGLLVLGAVSGRGELDVPVNVSKQADAP